MKSTFLILFSFFTLSFIYGQPGPAFTLQLDIDHFQRSETVYLALSTGSQFELQDSMICKDGQVVFVKSSPPQIGLYRIIWGEDFYVEFIISNEKFIHLKTDELDLPNATTVIASEENKKFIPVVKIKEKIDLLIKQGDVIYAEKKDPKAFAVIMYQIDSLRKDIKNQLSQMSSASFAHKVIKASLIPDLYEFAQNNPEHGYSDEAGFLRRHCFDNIDKEDSNLVFTPVIYEACSFYLRNLLPENTIPQFIKSVDFIVSQFSRNDAQFNYVLDLMLSTFETEEYDEVYLHIYDTYMSHSSCEGGVPGDRERKALSIKNLRKGNDAPELTGRTIDQEVLSLKNLSGKPVLVFFWASSCSHCKAIMPIINDLYKVYQPKGLEIIGFAIDTVETEVEKASILNEMKFPIISDYKGYDGKTAVDWCVWGTPSFFLIDKDGKIYSKPSSNNALIRDVKNICIQ